MADLSVRFIGTGTPLGQQGRLQPCILLSDDETRVLLDCGATSLVGLARAGVEPAAIDAVALTHLHGDHFGGVPLLLLDAAVRKWPPRERPLRIAGPAATAAQVHSALDVFGWSASWTYVQQSGVVEFVVLEDRRPTPIFSSSASGR